MALLSTPTRQANGDRSAPLVATTNDGVLLLDLLYDILLCLPVDLLCHLRAVCWSWRSILSHPNFIAAHRARHPLFAVSAHSPENAGRIDVHILDRSGRVVKRLIAVEESMDLYPDIMCTLPDMVCLFEARRRLHILNPATGAVSQLDCPDNRNDRIHCTYLAVGRTASTGESKVLSVRVRHNSGDQALVCKILTLGSGGSGWREADSPSIPLKGWCWRNAILNGVLYVLQECDQHIAAFDFEREQWQPNHLLVPKPTWRDGVTLAQMDHTYLDLVTLNGSLVVVRQYHDTSREMWFLVDASKDLWCKRYKITKLYQYHESFFHGSGVPLWVLDEGKIIFCVRQLDCQGVVSGVLRTYDLGTHTFTDGEELAHWHDVRAYHGSLLTPHM